MKRRIEGHSGQDRSIKTECRYPPFPDNSAVILVQLMKEFLHDASNGNRPLRHSAILID
jgi:hypothetical protein